MKQRDSFYITVPVLGSDEDSMKKAMSIFKKKCNNSGLMRKLKEKRAFERPAEKKRRKAKESARKRYRDEMKKKERQKFFKRKKK